MIHPGRYRLDTTWRPLLTTRDTDDPTDPIVMIADDGTATGANLDAFYGQSWIVMHMCTLGPMLTAGIPARYLLVAGRKAAQIENYYFHDYDATLTIDQAGGITVTPWVH